VSSGVGRPGVGPVAGGGPLLGREGRADPVRARARLAFIKARDLRLAGGAKLGQGSFGAVQKAEWDGTPVAVKVRWACLGWDGLAWGGMGLPGVGWACPG
jgi:hypothetical protein